MKKTSTIFMLAFVCFLFMIPIICYVFELTDISRFAVAATISGLLDLLRITQQESGPAVTITRRSPRSEAVPPTIRRSGKRS